MPAQQLDALVDAVRTAGRLAILTGTGSTMNHHANLGEWMAWALIVVTDSFDQPGGMWFNPGVFSRSTVSTCCRGGTDRACVTRPPGRGALRGEWPAALIADEIESGRLRALVVLGANLLTALPEPARLGPALAALDALIVLDVVHNDTSDLATHVFSCAGQLERPDVISLEPNAAFRYQQYTDAVVAERDDRPPMWQTLARIGAGIGLDVLGDGADPRSVSPDEMFRRFARGDGVAELRSGWLPRRRRPDVRLGALPVAVRRVEARARPSRRPTRCPRCLGALDAAGGADATAADQADELAAVPYRRDQRRDDPSRPGCPLRPGRRGMVEIATSTGSLRLPVRVSDTVMPGVVSVVHGFETENVNAVLDRNDLIHSPEWRTCRPSRSP